jgi:hypothetical protein
LSYGTSNHATLNSEPIVSHVEETLSNSQAVFKDTENTSASCSAVALNNGFYSVTPYTPLTCPAIQQHNIENSGLSGNPSTKYYFRQAAIHRIGFGDVAVDISLPLNLDAEFTGSYDGMAPQQRFEASATDHIRGNAAVEQHIQKFCIELDNDSPTYQAVEQLDAHPHHQLISEAHARNPIRQPQTYLEPLPWEGKITQGLTSWGNDLAGVGTHFAEDLSSEHLQSRGVGNHK